MHFECKLFTGAICRGLHWYTMQCIHPSQRCISTRQMTHNIFEIETTALAQVACAPQESGVLLSDFAAAYPSVNHSWIFSVLEHTGLSDFLHFFFDEAFLGTAKSRCIPGKPGNLDFLQLAHCAYADDIAVASASFRDDVRIGTCIPFPWIPSLASF